MDFCLEQPKNENNKSLGEFFFSKKLTLLESKNSGVCRLPGEQKLVCYETPFIAKEKADK